VAQIANAVTVAAVPLVFSAVTVQVLPLPLETRTMTAELDVENPPPSTTLEPVQFTPELPVE
jgi:hypothetical protein